MKLANNLFVTKWLLLSLSFYFPICLYYSICLSLSIWVVAFVLFNFEIKQADYRLRKKIFLEKGIGLFLIFILFNYFNFAKLV